MGRKKIEVPKVTYFVNKDGIKLFKDSKFVYEHFTFEIIKHRYQLLNSETVKKTSLIKELSSYKNNKDRVIIERYELIGAPTDWLTKNKYDEGL